VLASAVRAQVLVRALAQVLVRVAVSAEWG
jgi:hypothetical protein